MFKFLNFKISIHVNRISDVVTNMYNHLIISKPDLILVYEYLTRIEIEISFHSCLDTIDPNIMF